MDALAARIKEIVLTIYPAILTELDISDEYLDFMIQEVIDRALVYMNRDQLVYQYELDLENMPQDNTAYDEFWAKYAYPIPSRLEKVLAHVVIGTVRTVQENLTADSKEVKSMKDHGQSVTFKDHFTSFLQSSSESEIFSGSVELLDRYFLPTIPK